MKKIGLLVFIFALVTGVVVTNIFSFGHATGNMFTFNFDWKGVRGSGNVITDTRDVTGFHGIEVGGIYQVEVVAGKDYGVTVEADDNLIPLIRTEVDGGILKISSDRRISPKSTIRIRVSAPDIDSLDVSGVANVNVTGLSNAGLSLESSGASKIALNGSTSKLTVDVSGAVRVDAEQLKAENVTVEASGASNVGVNVSGILRAETSGASRVSYSGSPTSVIKDTSGAGSVTAKQ